MSTGDQSSEDKSHGRGGRRFRKLLIWGGIGLVVVIALAIALAPTIGSSLAPGIVEGAVNPDIKGHVKVHKASIGWFSGLKAGPIEVYDPAGALVATVKAEAPFTAWQAVSGRYWSAKSLDLGTLEVSGKLDLRQYADGTTNLDRAFWPADPAKAKAKPPKPAPSSAKPGKPLPAVKATLKVTQLDVSVRDERDQFASEIGLKQFKGEAKLDADPSAAGGGVVKAQADFSGTAVTSSAAAAGSPTAIKLDADIKQTAAGTWSAEGIERAKVKLALSNLPIAVADALGKFGGSLVQGVGPAADVSVDLDGNASQMAAAMKIASAGLNTDTNLVIKDGELSASADKPNAFSLKSTEFLQNLPPTREGVAKAAQQVKLTQAPSVQITLDSLRIPLSKGGEDVSKLDFRGASVVLKVKVSEMSGQVLLPEGGGAAPAPPPGASGTPASPPAPAPGTWKPFSVEPVELAVNITDFAKPIDINTGTRATIDGQPAGAVNLSLQADGLLDGQGHLRALSGDKAGFADRAEARVSVEGLSTALLQPVVTGALGDMPLQLAQDVGPTLDVKLQAKADVAGVTDPGSLGAGLEGLPPLDVTGEIASRNVHATAATRLEKALLTTSGEGIRFTVDAAAPLAQRIVAAKREAQLKDPQRDPAAPPPPEITLTGAGKLELTARDLAIPLKDVSAAAILSRGRGVMGASLADLNAAVDMGGSKAPVHIERYAIAAELSDKANPTVSVDGKLAHENQLFTISGGYQFNRLEKGLPSGSGPAQLVALKPVGAIDVKGLPRSLLGIVPALSPYADGGQATDTASEQAKPVARAVREAIGPTADLTLRMVQAPTDKGGGQYVAAIVKTAGDGAFADIWLRVAENLAEISSVSLYARPDPRWMNPLLESMTSPAAPDQRAPAPMRLGAPVKINLVVDQPAKIPLITASDGAVSPDWSKAEELVARLGSSGELAIENVPMGGGEMDEKGKPTPVRTAALALRNFGGEVRVPLSGIPDEARARTRASVKLGAGAFDRGAGNAPLGKFDLSAQANMDGSSPDATVVLAGVNTAALGALTGQQDMLASVLGDAADATLRVKPGGGGGEGATAGEVIAIDAELTAPRVKGAKLALAKDDAHLWLTQPATITWDPSLKLINKILAPEGGASAAPAPSDKQPARPARRRRKQAPAEAGGGVGGGPQPAPVSVAQAQPVTINLSRLGIAMAGQTGAPGQPAAGPLKPGIFELDLAVHAPSLAGSIAPGQAGQQPTPMTIEGLNVTARSPKAAARAAASNPVVLDLAIDRVSAGPEASKAGKKSTANIQIANLAGPQGAVNAAGATINADVDIASFPTAIVDNLANQHGLLTELLGPTVSLVAKARNVSKGATAAGSPAGSTAGGMGGSGSLSVDAASPRATAKLVGDIRGGEFIQAGPLSVELREIRTQLVEALAGGLPLVESLEKTPKDQPATVTTENLTVPLDNDLRKLNGKVTVDPGEARFTTSNIIGQIVKGIGGKEAGTIGRRIEPFVVTLDRGVANYDRFKLPVGEFALETRGQVDLVNNTMNVVTYVPFFALTDDAAGKLNLGVAGKLGVLDRNTMIPITTKGSLDDPQTQLDMELFLKEAPGNILKEPGKILEDLLKPKDKDKKK